MPTRGFTAVVSVFGAHLLRSPSTVKSGPLTRTPAPSVSEHTPSGEKLGSPASGFLRSAVSSRHQQFLVHSLSPFGDSFHSSFHDPLTVGTGKTKNPASVSEGRVGKIGFGVLALLTCLAVVLHRGNRLIKGDSGSSAGPACLCRSTTRLPYFRGRRRATEQTMLCAGEHRMWESKYQLRLGSARIISENSSEDSRSEERRVGKEC